MAVNYERAVIDVCSDMFMSDDISATDNFFMLGGTSRKVLELADELLARFRVELPLLAVFASETLAEIATHCRGADED
jgi:acyl carrier protein